MVFFISVACNSDFQFHKYSLRQKWCHFHKHLGSMGFKLLLVPPKSYTVASMQNKHVCGCSQDSCVRKTLMNVVHFPVFTMQHVLMALPTTAASVLRVTLGDCVKKNH